MSELAQQIEQLKAAHTIDAEPRRPQQERVATEEEPITIRARRRIQAVLVPETPDPEPAQQEPQQQIEPAPPAEQEPKPQTNETKIAAVLPRDVRTSREYARWMPQGQLSLF